MQENTEGQDAVCSGRDRMLSPESMGHAEGVQPVSVPLSAYTWQGSTAEPGLCAYPPSPPCGSLESRDVLGVREAPMDRKGDYSARTGPLV